MSEVSEVEINNSVKDGLDISEPKELTDEEEEARKKEIFARAAAVEAERKKARDEKIANAEPKQLVGIDVGAKPPPHQNNSGEEDRLRHEADEVERNDQEYLNSLTPSKRKEVEERRIIASRMQDPTLGGSGTSGYGSFMKNDAEYRGTDKK